MIKAGRSARVALVGASGIGKHHGKWWALEGAEVCAFVGTSKESVAKTRDTLKDLFGFEGRGYTDLGAMLQAESPQVVDVCSPPPCHSGHVRAALEAGCDVLCEKPFVYDARVPRETLLVQAGELAGLADQLGRRLGVCTQYTAGARMFSRIWRETHAGEEIVEYHGHLEAPAKGRAPDPRRVWVDLSPHAISVLLDIAPDCQVDWDSLCTTFQGYEALATFSVRRREGRPLRCELYTRNTTEPPLHVRHFKYNEYRFVVEGQNDADGVYCARIETPDGDYVEPDMMRLLIRDFLAGTPTIDAKASLANLDLMLRVLEASGAY